MLTVQESQLVTGESQGNAEHWAELQELGKVGENPHSEPEKDTQPCLALPGFPWAWEHWATGMVALLWDWLWASSSEKWGDPAACGGRLERLWGFQEEERFHESIAQSRTSLGTLSIWADLTLGRKEKLLPNWNVSPTNPKVLGGCSSPGTEALLLLQAPVMPQGAASHLFRLIAPSQNVLFFQLTRLGRSLFRTLANKLSTTGSRLWKNKGAP